MPPQPRVADCIARIEQQDEQISQLQAALAASQAQPKPLFSADERALLENKPGLSAQADLAVATVQRLDAALGKLQDPAPTSEKVASAVEDVKQGTSMPARAFKLLERAEGLHTSADALCLHGQSAARRAGCSEGAYSSAQKERGCRRQKGGALHTGGGTARRAGRSVLVAQGPKPLMHIS